MILNHAPEEGEKTSSLQTARAQEEIKEKGMQPTRQTWRRKTKDGIGKTPSMGLDREIEINGTARLRAGSNGEVQIPGQEKAEKKDKKDFSVVSFNSRPI